MTITLDGTSGITTPTINGTGEHVTYVTGFKNRIINGGMVIDQRNAGDASVSAFQGYFLDRWVITQTITGKLIAQQNQGNITPPVGFSNYLGVTSQSAYSVLTGDTYLFRQNIEGFNFADMNWGTANASTVTLSFRVYSSLTGTFGGALTNAATNRSYLFSYSIPVANTWTTISVTIAGDVTGTWIGATNGVVVEVRFGLGSGATYSGTAGSWQAGNIVQPTGTVSVVGTSGATFYITGVQLEKGSVATSFDQRAYSQELAMCQRYYQVMSITGIAMTTNAFQPTRQLIVTMRTAPTIGITGSMRRTADGVVSTVGALIGASGDTYASSVLYIQCTPTPALVIGSTYDSLGSIGSITASAEL